MLFFAFSQHKATQSATHKQVFDQHTHPMSANTHKQMFEWWGHGFSKYRAKSEQIYVCVLHAFTKLVFSISFTKLVFSIGFTKSTFVTYVILTLKCSILVCKVQFLHFRLFILFYYPYENQNYLHHLYHRLQQLNK